MKAAASPSQAPLRERYGRLLSCSAPADGLSMLDFLAANAGQPRFSWACASGAVAYAGVGAALELSAWGLGRFAKIADEARELFADACLADDQHPAAGPRLFGGFAFRHDFTPDNTWSIYTPALFALPHYQLSRLGDRQWLTINAQIPPDEAPGGLIADLQAALRGKLAETRRIARTAKDEAQSPLLDIAYPMPYSAWESMINAAVERIRGGALAKAVLARAAELRFGGRVQLLPVMRHLARRYPDCYRFLFEPRPGCAFYGASPELLAAVTGRRLETMALAGSMARGETAAEDERLGARLLASAKERGEHDIVAVKMRERLRPLTDKLEGAPVDLLKLRHIQHLRTRFHASLKREAGVLPIIEALHPTPALGGDPREAALRLIRALEPIPRGWYGGPVGWIDSRLDGQFAVAIRSAAAQESRAWIYAGGGVVRESGARAEWDETALKFRPMLGAHTAFSPPRHRE